MKIEADGSFSDGFNTNVLPHAIAGAHIHIGTMAGKLNGVIPATTPTGCRIEYTSTPVEACSENSPLNSVGIPQAYSITSSPRVTSPIASDSTLPCSATSSFAISSLFSCTSSPDRGTSAPRAGPATPTATTRTRPSPTAPPGRPPPPTPGRRQPVCRPVAGLNTGLVRPDVPATEAPSIQWWMGAIAAPFESGALTGRRCELGHVSLLKM